jgi:pimeloyl-ACP methyl ester carboxylesterase
MCSRVSRRQILGAALLACATVLACAPSIARAGWQESLDALVAATDEGAQSELLSEVMEFDPSWVEVAERIGATEFPAVDSLGVPRLRSTACIDTVERPWVLQVPAGYDPAVPTPLLVILHGGVGRAEVTDEPLEYARENQLGALALERNWIALFPFGQAGATWWDEVGMTNIRDLVRTVKRELNVDDDRVWMAGFSDGASAGFAHAMLAPNDYAGFLALNGHMGVASLDGDLPTYAVNMAATPLFVTTTFDDELYPSSRMRATIKMARAAGADIDYREFPGTHSFEGVEEEIPGMGRFLARHTRDPFPHRVVWEAGDAEFGACRWFAIDRITSDEPASWYEDHNSSLVDDRITIGFQPDYEFEGRGILVGVLSDGDYPARSIGLQAGDVIVKADDARVDSLQDLNDWKETVERGDPFEMTVLREGREMVLAGELPPPAGYFIFKREVPSAVARVDYAANRVKVQTSRVGAFRVLVHPDLFDLDQEVIVEVDGVEVFRGFVEPDPRFMLENYLSNRDRKLLYVAEIAVELQ